MSDKRFDDDIKKALESYQEDYDVSSWEEFSSYMDSKTVSDIDADSDQILHDKLSNHEEPVHEEHWSSMRSDLDIIDQKKERLWFIKSLEVVIILLLFVTIENFTSSSSSEHILKYAHVEQSENSTDFIKSPEVFNPQKEYSNNKSSLIADVDDTLTPQKGAESREVYVALLRNVPLRSLEINDRIHLDISTSSKQSKLSTLPAKEQRIHIEPVDMSLAHAISDDHAQNTRFAIDMTVARDVNVINSSPIAVPISHLGRSVSGHSFGLLGSVFLSDNVMLSTGVVYSNKTHRPGRLKSVTKASQRTYLETQLDYINLQQIQIPLLVRLGLNPLNNSGLYGTAGIGINAITNYHYETRKFVQPSNRVTSLDVSNGIDLNQLPNGLLNRGNVSENFYLTGVVGFGYQTVLPNNASLFLQPQYQFSFGRGANDYIRRVHSFNMEAGVRFLFGK